MYRLIIIILSTFFIKISFAKEHNDKLPNPFVVVPQPREITLIKNQKGLRASDLDFLVCDETTKRPVLGDILNQLPERNKTKGSGKLILRLDSSQVVPESKEGYILSVADGNAEIISRGEAGLFYGCQTLEQLLEDALEFDTEIPACNIKDWPALPYRAVHFDVKHHLDHMNYYYESIDRLARYKINAVIFEFEDKLRYVRQPLVGAPQAISIDEMAALTQYACDRHIEISPLVQGLGHATFILKHQEYAPLRELKNNRWAFCPLHEGTYQVLFDLYRDAIDATPGSKYLHVGGDEIGNIGLCPRCKPTFEKEGNLNLILYWMTRVCEFAKENDRIPIVWDDMPLHNAGLLQTTRKDLPVEEAERLWEEGEAKLEELIADFPKNAVYMRWNYTTIGKYGDSRALDWYKKNGLKAMVATAAQSGPAAIFPFENREIHPYRGTPAIKHLVELAAEKSVDGMLCTAWDDRSPHFETYWRGFITSAEYSWSPGIRSLEELDLAYLEKEYGTSEQNYAILYRNLREAATFYEKAFTRNGSRLDLHNTLFNLPGVAHWLPPRKEGEPEITDFTDRLIELPDVNNPGDWTKKYSQRLMEAKKILNEYSNTSEALQKLYQNSEKNRYHWEVFSALNDFQVTAPELLTALEKCDAADKNQHWEGIKQVHTALMNFDTAWNNLKQVYTKTRFIDYPANYVPDRYFHFASQREDLTWMIQVEELFHDMINNWITNE